MERLELEQKNAVEMATKDSYKLRDASQKQIEMELQNLRELAQSKKAEAIREILKRVTN